MSETEPQNEYERLALARRHRYPSQAAFAEKVGIHPTTYRAYENGQNGFAKHAALFAQALGVPTEWLLSGRERPAHLYPAASPPRLPDTIDKASDLPRMITASDDDPSVEIVQLDFSYAMGPGTSPDDWPEMVKVRFDPNFIRSVTRAEPSRLYVAKGDGDSMFPTLIPDDQVLVDTTQRVLNMQDRIWAISVHGASMIKRLRTAGKGRVRILSDNDRVPPDEVDAEDLYIFGRVIWVGRRV